MQGSTREGNHSVRFLMGRALTCHWHSTNTAKRMTLQKHEAVVPNPGAMSKAEEKDLPRENFLFFSDQSHSAARKVPRDGENYAPRFAQHAPLSGADLYPLGNK